MTSKDINILQDIQRELHDLIGMLLEKHGEAASLAIPAVLLKTTLQIYQYTLKDNDSVEAVIKSSIDSLEDLPPLIPKKVIH